MNKEEFIKLVKKEFDLDLSEFQLNQLEIYCNFLIEYNQHTNLTAITDISQIYLKHFYDSLTFLKAAYPKENDKIIDVGTGAGFPGMILKIVFPKIKLVLLDSNNKKITFLQELAKKLDINDIEYYHGRVEDYCLKHRETFDFVTARAVSNMTELSELCLPLVKINGYFIAMKGSNSDEIEEARYAIDKLSGNIEKIIKITLPKEESIRNIVMVKKIKATPNIYPRRYDKIKKNPLKNSKK